MAEIEQFLYLAAYLRRFIPGRAEHSQIMKEAAGKQEVAGKKPVAGKPGAANNRQELIQEWKWGEQQEASFQHIKRSICENAMVGGDPSYQYHIAAEAYQREIRGVVFQLPGMKPGTTMEWKHAGEMRIIMFISQKLSDAESRYLNTEQEGLAVLRYLEKVRWLVTGSPYPTKVYTDHSVLLLLLQGEGISYKGRLSSWLVRMSEYDVEYVHVKGEDNVLADGMSRLPVTAMNVPSSVGDWEDVAMAEESGESQESQEKETNSRRIPRSGNKIPSPGRDNNKGENHKEDVEDRGVGENHKEDVEDRLEDRIEESMRRWEHWLNDDWYGDVVEYKITGRIAGELKHGRGTRRAKL